MSSVQILVDASTRRAQRYDPGLVYPGTEYVDNWEWEATLRYEGIERGRSAAHFLWRDVHDRLVFETDDDELWERYENPPHVMFMQQMGEILLAGGVMSREMSGIWTYVKRGQNFGIKLVTQHTYSGTS